jgi:hypothetical protein
MAHRSKNGIRNALDTAAGGADINPVPRKPRATLQGGGGQKYSGNQDDAPEVITELVHIENCIYDVAPRFAKA